MQNLWSITGRSIAVSALALALTACQSMRGPEPVVEPNISGNYLINNSGPSIAELGYKEYFSDPRLIKVIDQALANNRDLRKAALNIDKAQAQYKITANGLLPTIGASAGALQQDVSNQISKSDSAYSVGLGLTNYEIDFWGRIRSLKDNALDNYLATASARDSTQIGLISQVAQAWVSYSYANAALDIANNTMKSQLESMNINQKRFDAGIDNGVALSNAKILVEQARADVYNYQTQVLQAKNLLDLLVGAPVDPSLLSRQKVTKITNNKVFNAGLPSNLLQNRPDIKTAEYQLSAAGANIGAARARMFPNINLVGNLSFASNDLNNLFKSGTSVWSYGLNLDVPIFDWGTRRANIKVSEADRAIALADYEKTIQSAFREVNDALAVRKNIAERLSSTQRLYEANYKTYTLNLARFRAGIDGFGMVLDAQRWTYTAEQGLNQLQQAEINNQIELYKALGGGIKANTSEVIEYAPSSAEKRQARDGENANKKLSPAERWFENRNSQPTNGK
jgi:outer membrane protein, multidrug efflux system